MKKRIFLLMTLAALLLAPLTARGGEAPLVDMAGREINLEAPADKVFSTGPIAAIYLYTLAPEHMLGWNYELNQTERSVILEEYQNLPNFGMNDAVNFEAVIAAAPSVALHVGGADEKTLAQAAQMEEILGVPVAVISDALEDAPAVYTFLGQLLGKPEAAAPLAEYAEKTFADIAEAQIPPEKQVRVYYGNGEDSLQTAAAGSSHGQILDMVGAVNVATLEVEDDARVIVSKEQVIAWNPEAVIVNGNPKNNVNGYTAAENFLHDPDFATLEAVESGAVYGAPNAPFSWIDRPAGPNRIIGLRYLAKKLYPEHFEYDMDEEVKTFYRLFYHTELTDQRLEEIYQGIVPELAEGEE